MIFALTCFTWGAKAQTQAQATLTVHDGTNLNQQVPLNFLYLEYYTRSQFVIPATELTELEGNTISSITFYTTSNNNYTSGPYVEVFVKEVNYTNITDFESNSGAANVYYGDISIEPVGGAMTITFNSPYVYQGGNLLIGIENASPDVMKMIYFYGENVTWNSAVAGHNNSSLESVTAIHQISFLPKTTFTYTPLCHTPTGLSATLDSYDGTIATLSWTARNNVTSWNIYYKKASDDDYTEILNVTNNTYTLSGLDDNTQYQYHVEANCSGSEVSDPSSDFNFTTGCGVLSLPQTFDFEYDGYGFLPECWTTTGNVHIVNIIGNHPSHSGSQLLCFMYGAHLYVALPKIEVPSTGLKVNFWTRPSSASSGDYFRVGYITNDDFSTFHEVAAYSSYQWGRPAKYKEKTVDLPDIPANGRIVFYDSDAGWDVWYIDDITVTAIPCKQPTDLQASVSVHTATLSWTNGAAGHSAWQIAYSTDAGFDPDTVANPVDVTSNPATINGLAAHTQYYAYVRTNCDIVGFSDWVGPVSFTTLVDCPAPTAVTANSITMHTVDLNWTDPNATPDSYNVRYRVAESIDPVVPAGEWDTITANESPKHLAGLDAETRYEAQVQSNCGPDELGQWTAPYFFATVAGNLPPTDLAVSDITPSTATASWTGVATNEHHQHYELYISPVSTAPTGPSVTGVTESSYTFTGLANSTSYYVWVRDYCGDDGYSSWTGPVDFVTLASCPAPKLTAEGIDVTAHTADVAWTGYTENDGGYVVKYRKVVPPGIATVFLSEDFESVEAGHLPDNWIRTSSYWHPCWNVAGSSNGKYAFCYIESGSDTLITPEMDLSSASNATLSFNFMNLAYSDGQDTYLDMFNVYYRVDNGDWILLYENSEEQSSWTTTPITVELTGLADHYQIGFRCSTRNDYWGFGNGIGVDDILVYSETVPGEWQTVTPNPTTTSTQLTGLDAETDYEVQVFGICDGETEEVGSDTVVFTTIEVCPAPTAFTLDAATTDEAVFSWTAGGTETAWQLYISTTNTAPDNDIAATAQGLYAASENPNILISDLDPGTEYYVWVRANCDTTDGYSTWAGPVNFATECAPIIIPAEGWSENFDSYAGTIYGSTNNLPICWSYINTSTDISFKGYPIICNTSGYSYSASNHLKFHSTNTAYDPQPQYAILPEMQNLNTKRIKLYARSYEYGSGSSCDGTFHVGIMTDPTDASTFVEIDSKTAPPTSYELYTIPFDTYTSEGTYIAIKVDAADNTIGNTSFTYRIVFIDDITVEEIPTCIKPTVAYVVENSETYNSVQLTWTSSNETPETNWKLQYKKADENSYTTVNVTSAQLTDGKYTLSGLDANSTYNWRVAAWCDPSDAESLSFYTDGPDFTTECAPVTINANNPYTENFNSYSGNVTSLSAPSDYPNHTLPTCWSFLNMSTSTSTYPQAFLTSSTDYAVSDNCLLFKSSNTAPLYAIMPELSNDISDLTLTFTYRNEIASIGTLIVGYMTDPTDETTFEPIFTCDKTTTKTEKNVFFENFPVGSYIAFKYQGDDYNNRCLSIDNISVKTTPCKRPSALMLSGAATAHTATLNWTNGEEGQNAWQIAYSKDANFDPDTVTTPVDVTTNPATIEGLDAGTQYYAYVRANCGSDEGMSAWSNRVAFVTECVAIDALGYTENFESYAGTNTFSTNNLPICWNYINTSTYNDYKGYPIICNLGYPLSYSCSNFLMFFSRYHVANIYDPQPQYAILPEMTNLAGKRITLMARDFLNNNGSTFKVGTMEDPTDVTTFKEISEQTGLTDEYHEYTFDIPTTTDRYVAIMIDAASSTRNFNSVYVDDISITTPPCLQAADVAVVYSNNSPTTAIITWDNNNGSDATYTVKQGETVLTNAATEIYTLTELTAATTYPAGTYTIISNCDESVVVDVPEFTTSPCAAIVVDAEHSYNVDMMVDEIPDCWTETVGNNHWQFSSNAGAYFQSSSNASLQTSNKLVSPLFNFGEGNYWMSFTALSLQ